jgi:DNA-binding CsgD family transcriptional regulator
VRPGSAAKLTRTELAVLAEYRRGRSTAEIASRLKRSPKTLYNHIDSASRKLGVSGRAAVLAVVVDQGLID